MGILLEAIVAGLLAVTIGYCYLLDKRLRELRSGQDGLNGVIQELERATHRAQTGLADLRQTSETLAQEITSRMAAAQALADELSLMVAAGNEIAERLHERPGRSARDLPVPGTGRRIADGVGRESPLYEKLRSAS